jgi:hypothetical protein
VPESSVVVRPQPPGSSGYSAASRLQAAGLRPAIALFEQAAAVVPLPRAPQPIVIADYGAATGHNSLLPIGSAIATLRGRTRPEHCVLVTHTDVPDNDFTAMFRTVADDPDSYLRKDSAVFTSAVGRSFYQQILPSNSVHLGWSSWAIQWLSRTPAPVPDHLHIAYSADEAVRSAYARQAAHDWHEFIAYRGRELCPGGRMVVMTMALGEDGGFGFEPLLTAMTDTLAELAGAGLLSADDLRAMTISTVARHRTDFLAPFAPSGRFERLEIEHLEVFDGDDRYFAEYRKDNDANAFGARWAQFARASVFPAMAATLSQPGRHPQVFDRLEAGITARLAAAPQATRIPLAHLVLHKRPKTH